MDTRELLEEYRRLTRAKDEAGAAALLEANRSDERFVSLVKLRNELLPAIVKKFSGVVDEVFGPDETPM